MKADTFADTSDACGTKLRRKRASSSPDVRVEVPLSLGPDRQDGQPAAAAALKKKLLEYRAEAMRLFALSLHPTAATILDEGAKLIVAGGGGAMTMRIAAMNANMTLSSLQYHFKTFEDLVSALFLREWGRIADLIWETLVRVEKEALPPAEALRCAAKSFVVPENSPTPNEDRLYFHLLSYCAYYEKASQHVRTFHGLFLYVIAYLVSKVNPSLGERECFDRAVLITAAFEGSNVYTVLLAGGAEAGRAMRREIGNLAVYYASLPALPAHGHQPVNKES